MKKLLSLAFILGISFGYYTKLGEHRSVVFAKSDASLPTTIDLNDNDDEEIRNYYQGLNSLSESERQGQNLLKNLKPILSNGQVKYSYDQGSGKSNAIWQLYEIIDRDWELSPKEEIAGYDSSTNKITGYQYTKTDPSVRALYVNREFANPMKAWGSHQQDYGGINREHIWPKSHGFDVEESYGTDGARGDPMHLWAADGYTNNIHNNLFYGYVDLTKDNLNCGDKFDYAVGNYRGTSKTLGSGTVFEPQDSDKGDIARSVFYMVARYNNLAGATSGIDANEPNLTLSNDLSENSRTGTSTATDAFSLGILQDLLEWNKLDPVDEFEIHRNNLLFNNYTKNRNPFIDFPEWADYIWGVSEGGVYDNTVTGAANPASDKINDGSQVKLLSKSSVTIENIGDKAEVDILVDPSLVTITNKNNDIVSVEKNGSKLVVTALKEGKATITASATVDGEDVVQNLMVKVGKQSNGSSGFKFDTTTLIIIGAIVVVVLIVLVIVFVSMSKKDRKKAIKTAKKIVKKSSKSSSGKSKKK